ncbi:MAG: hypothetical protein ACXV4A_03475 [Actinomycetes bacterium]
MTERTDTYSARPRGEDVERAHENEGATEDVEPEREGEAVEGRGAEDSGVV